MAKFGTVLITGAAGALGGAVVDRFLKEGIEVVGTSLDGSGPSKKGLRWIDLDLSDSRQVTEKLAGLAVDAWINCAGGFRYAPVEETSDADFEFLFKANFHSSFLLFRTLLPGMKKRGFGRIVVVSARSSLQSPAGMSAYGATKAALNALVQSVAEEVKSSGADIAVNAVLPSTIDTPANRRDMPKADFAKWVTVEQLAEVMFTMTQPGFSALNGALVPVSGRV
jgi:3-oxoacyl-[acyl-carrier protein] reductase